MSSAARTTSASAIDAIAGRRVAAASAPKDSEDPFARVVHLGDRAARVGVAIGLIIALGTHGWFSVRAISSLYEMLRLSQGERETLHEYFWATYDVDLNKPDKPDKPDEAPPIPEPEPEPTPKAAAPKAEKDLYEPPPPPAQAAKVLTREASPNDDLEDMTNTIVSGDGTAISGQISAAGKGDKQVTGHTAVGGVVGGTGTASAVPPPPPPPTGPDLSRSPGLASGSGGNWNCPFPPEADTDSIDKADAVIVVTVRGDGSPASASVVRDPGHGFGRAARACAMGRHYTPGLDRSGAAITMTSPPITVHFTR